MNTKQIGDISESVVITKLLKTGKSVLIPFGDKDRYDLVLYDGNVFERIQVKTGRLKNGCIVANATSITTINGKPVKKNYIGQIDKFAIYCPELDTVYIVPVGTYRDGITLRIGKTKNNQTKGIVYAKDFEV